VLIIKISISSISIAKLCSACVACVVARRTGGCNFGAGWGIKCDHCALQRRTCQLPLMHNNEIYYIDLAEYTL
jgi:capsule polysaccharide export protein KpsC/LpsZ